MTRTELLISRYNKFEKDWHIDDNGVPTIGYGFNLNVGLSEPEARALMACKINLIREHLKYALPFFNALSTNRQDVLVDMGYNLGINGLLKLKTMLSAIYEKNYPRAKMELLNSEEAKESPERYENLAALMLEG